MCLGCGVAWKSPPTRIGRVGCSSLKNVVSQPKMSRYMSYPWGVWICGMYTEVASIWDPDFGCRRATAR